jgi:hypothetical protein
MTTSPTTHKEFELINNSTPIIIISSTNFTDNSISSSISTFKTTNDRLLSSTLELTALENEENEDENKTLPNYIFEKTTISFNHISTNTERNSPPNVFTIQEINNSTENNILKEADFYECERDKLKLNWSKCLDKIEGSLKSINFVEVEKTLGAILEITRKDNDINELDQINNVMKIIRKIQNFVQENPDIKLNDALNHTSKTLEIISNLINQKDAWIKSSTENKTETGSKILSLIQLSSEVLTCRQESRNENIILKNENIFFEAFVTYFDEIITFPNSSGVKSSSIFIPKGIKQIKNFQNCNNSAIGILINKLQDYLLGEVKNLEYIGSEILAFSLSNGTKPIKLNKKVNIR